MSTVMAEAGVCMYESGCCVRVYVRVCACVRARVVCACVRADHGG